MAKTSHAWKLMEIRSSRYFTRLESLKLQLRLLRALLPDDYDVLMQQLSSLQTEFLPPPLWEIYGLYWPLAAV